MVGLGQRTALAAAAGLLVLLPAAARRAGGGEAAAPRISCDEPSYNFGEADNRRTVEHEFVIRNGGASGLVVTKLWSGCPCASATVASSNVAPGGRTEVKVTVDLRGRGGEQKKSIYVHSNDPTQGVLRLELSGTAVPWVKVAPERLDFGNAGVDAAEARDATLSWRPGAGFSVTNVRTTERQFRAEVAPPAPDKACRITVRTVPPLPPGVTRASVVAQTDDPSCPSVDIPVVVAALTDLVVVPSELAAGGSEAPCLAVRSRSGREFKIVGVDVPDSVMKPVVTPMGAQGYRIRFSLPKTAGAGEEVRIRTDLPGAEEGVVPIKAAR